MSCAEIEIERRDRMTHGEYVATLPGKEAAAKLTWTMHNNVRDAEHTFVPPELRGQGIAKHLVDALIADARREGLKIRPTCSYVAAQFEENPEWSDVRA